MSAECLSRSCEHRTVSRAIPLLFVFLWSTGFIGAKLGLPYAEPYTFLFIRLLITSLLLFVCVLVLRKKWPQGWRLNAHISVSGLLIHGGYLGGVFTAIKLGMPSGLVALIAGLQPLITAILAGPLLGEKVSKLQWSGLLMGMAGVSLVLSEKLDFSNPQLFDGFGLAAVLFSFIAVFSITASSLYQKRYCTAMPMMSGTLVQYAATMILYFFLSLTFETGYVDWNAEFIFSLFWLIFVPSLGGITLLMWMIKQGQASKVASLFYLVPPVTAFEAFILFDEKLGIIALAGMGLASVGVWLAFKK